MSGYYFKVTITIPENPNTSGRTHTIRANQPNGLSRELVQTAQQSASAYEFYITDSDGNGHYADFTFSAPSEGLSNKHAFNLISTHNGSPLSVDEIEMVDTGIETSGIGIILTQDNQSPFKFNANIAQNSSTSVKTGADTFRQKPSGKTVIFRVLQEAKINKFRLELSLYISNGKDDQDTWGLFDTANMPHTSDLMYDMSLIREGILVDSVEGKITVNSLQSTTKDIGVGDNVYVWAYNSVRGLWLSIGNFRIEEGENTHHWDVSWPT